MAIINPLENMLRSVGIGMPTESLEATTPPPAAGERQGAGTWTLPEKGEALKLVAADYEAAAKELGVETAAVHAVAEVESGGRTGFDASSRPKILFETHHFREYSGGAFNTSHPELTAPYKSKLQRASYKKNQWEVMKAAFALHQEAAVKSASWGMFQVLGSNAKDAGWSSLEQFVKDMFYSEGQHMRAFLGFCKANQLTRYLSTKDWVAFARGYNGKHYADFHYDVKMARAYARYSGNPGAGPTEPNAHHARRGRHGKARARR